MNTFSEIIDYTHPVEIPVINLSDIKWKEPGLAKIYRDNSKCPYCAYQLHVVLEMTEDKLDDKIHYILRSCRACGWWYSVAVCEDLGYYSGYIVPIIRKFIVDNLDLPISALEMELQRKPDVLNYIHPRKLEELVQSVFSDYFKTEVTLIGKSGDGGIDLLFCEGENPVAVQVKRRSKKDTAEGVSVVREFIGAMLLKGIRSGIFVSTADRFSYPAKTAARTGADKGIVQELKLIDAKSFWGMFQLKSKRANFPWEQVYYNLAVGKYPKSSFISVDRNHSSILDKYQIDTSV